MIRTVYLDLLFLINFSMDFLCIYIAAKIMSARLNVGRSVVSAVIGGVYSCAALFIPSGYFITLLCDVGTCFLMCAIAFGRRVGLFFSSIVYFAVSMALGGFMTALFNLLNRLGFSSLEGAENSDGISVWLFLLLAIVSAAFTLAGGKFFKRNSKITKAELRISEGGREKKLTALVDSGNLLREPISGMACVVIASSAVRDLFSPELIEMVEKGGRASFEYLPDALGKRIRLVPTLTATGEKMLVGIRPHALFINFGKGEKEIDAMLVFSHFPSPQDQGAQALVPLELLN